jgi:hypothetical protein
MNQASEMEMFTWMSPMAVTCLEADSHREAATQTTMHNSPIENSMRALVALEVPGRGAWMWDMGCGRYVNGWGGAAGSIPSKWSDVQFSLFHLFFFGFLAVICFASVFFSFLLFSCIIFLYFHLFIFAYFHLCILSSLHTFIFHAFILSCFQNKSIAHPECGLLQDNVS